MDDETDILMALGGYLAAVIPGLVIQTAPDAAKALQVLSTHDVGLILSDYRMPGMNGLALLQEAQRLYPNIPAILMTAYPDAELAARALNEAKIKAFLTKPVDPDKLRLLVCEFMGLAPG